MRTETKVESGITQAATRVAIVLTKFADLAEQTNIPRFTLVDSISKYLVINQSEINSAHCSR